MKHIYLVFLGLLIFFNARANVIGADFQNFNPTTNGLDFVTVQSSETLQPGILNLGYFVNYAANTLPYFESAYSIQNRTHYNDYVVSGDLNIGLGLGKNWDFGVNLPHLLKQNVDSDLDHGEFENHGFTEIRVNSKYRFYGDENHGLATIVSLDYNLVKNNPYAGDGSGHVINLEFAADTTIGKVALAGNIGYRWRQQGEQLADFPEIAPYGDQFIASVAASYLFSSIDTKLITEIISGFPKSGTNTGTERSVSSNEFLLGLKHDINNKIAIHFGAGTELSSGTASPDLRVYAGLNYAAGPLWVAKKPEVVTNGSGSIAVDEEVDEDLPEVDTIDNGEIYKLTKVEFEFDSTHKAVGAAKRELDAMANRILNKGYSQIVIAGHTDSVGSEAYNQILSEKRASTVRRYLIENHGVDVNKIKSIGFGETRPIADNGNYQGRQQNRRVEVIAMSKGEWPGYDDAPIPPEYLQEPAYVPESKKSRVKPSIEKTKPKSKSKKIPRKLPKKLPKKKPVF